MIILVLNEFVVKLLLSNGHIVHGAVRDPKDEKYAQLNKLERAFGNLKHFNADLLDYDSLQLAIEGCDGAIHVASPVASNTIHLQKVQVLEPAMKGTLNVLKACLEAKVKRVVHVSSVAAVLMSPKWPKDRVLDEICWSDKEYCRNKCNYLSTTEAESAAFEYAKQTRLDVVSVCPGLIIGPVLQPPLNMRTMILLKVVKGTFIQGNFPGTEPHCARVFGTDFRLEPI
ncbi:cinnamoyl-CoA reductase 1-like [Punica granatum]|uniref:Cinnamoyl-CoA reductase 1-like n=1 Tax=Punica granatum TaxID=22663 RepID=A0A6P8EKG3_PUNGR|nr:cinnamoyl-CoA reductase 1-like [Punica granatum]